MARILRGLSSRLLDCGCLLGIYEMYDGAVMGLLDSKGPACSVSSHERGNEIPVDRSRSSSRPGEPSDSADPADA